MESASEGLESFCHDLRQYVAAGILLSRMPGDEGLDDEFHRRLEMIGQLFAHMRGMIGAENAETGVRRVDVAALTADCVRVNELSRDIRVAARFTGAEPVLADPVLLRRAVANVLDNAIRAAGEKGSICVSVGHQGEEVVVEVCDDGVGFGRIPSGTGHGLSVVDTAVRASQGRLEIRSGPGPGTCVRLVFPRMSEPEEQP